MAKQPIESQAASQEIDFKSPLPLHYQLREIIRNEALNGTIVDKSGKMPTEHELMDRFKVSRITVRHALKILEDEGILRRERGRGTFLQTNQAENWSGQLLGFSEAIRGIGMEPGSEVLAYGTVKEVPETVKSHLQLDELWELKRLRYADNVAIAIEHNYFPMEVGRQLEEQDLLTVTIYKFIESEAGITLRNGKQLISAINANKEEAELLDVAEGSALLSIERVIYDAAQNPIEYLKAVYRPDHFQYTIHLHR